MWSQLHKAIASGGLKMMIYVKIEKDMNNLVRGLIAGFTAKKLGGGCLGTFVVFAIVWALLGQCN